MSIHTGRRKSQATTNTRKTSMNIYDLIKNTEKVRVFNPVTLQSVKVHKIQYASNGDDSKIRLSASVIGSRDNLYNVIVVFDKILMKDISDRQYIVPVGVYRNGKLRKKVFIRRITSRSKPRVRCSCTDFKYTWARVLNEEEQLTGPEFEYEETTGTGKPRNPGRIMGVCKHIEVVTRWMEEKKMFRYNRDGIIYYQQGRKEETKDHDPEPQEAPEPAARKPRRTTSKSREETSELPQKVLPRQGHKASRRVETEVPPTKDVITSREVTESLETREDEQQPVVTRKTARMKMKGRLTKIREIAQKKVNFVTQTMLSSLDDVDRHLIENTLTQDEMSILINNGRVILADQ